MSERVDSAGAGGCPRIATAVLVTLGLFFVVDVATCARFMTAGSTPPTLGFILLSATVLGGGIGLVLQLLVAAGRRVPQRRTRALGAAVIAWFPADWLAAVVTSGSGISRSGWSATVRIALLVVLVLAAAFAGGVLPAVYQRPRRTRIRFGVGLLVLGLVALAITSFHAITYVRAYRGVLVVAALLLELGVIFVVRGSDARSNRCNVVGAAVLAAILALALGLSRIGGSRRAYASYNIFANTLVAQKIQPILARVSPVFRPTARVSLDDMRLARDNAVPVPALSSGRYAGSNVLFVTFDALRADTVGMTLDGHPVAPNLQLLAAHGILFENAVSNYSHTSRSLLSILAGSWDVRFPSETRVSTRPVDVRARSRLPRLLHAAGYETIAIMMSGRWGEIFFDKDRFPAFDHHISAGEHCEAQVAAFQRYLAERTSSRPFFAWVHIFDTHTPHEVTTSDRLFGDSVPGQYAAAVHRADRCFGDLLAAVQRASGWDRTIVIASADHGEATGEHGRRLQHSTCYWHDIHIPLIVRLPDVHGPVAVEYPVQPADLLPTLARLLGARTDEPEVDGDDLSGLFDGTAAHAAAASSSAAMAFAQGHLQQYPCASVVSERWHLIYTDAGRTYELYDVASDAKEEHNVAADRLDVFERLQPVLDSFRARVANTRQR